MFEPNPFSLTKQLEDCEQMYGPYGPNPHWTSAYYHGQVNMLISFFYKNTLLFIVVHFLHFYLFKAFKFTTSLMVVFSLTALQTRIVVSGKIENLQYAINGDIKCSFNILDWFKFLTQYFNLNRILEDLSKTIVALTTKEGTHQIFKAYVAYTLLNDIIILLFTFL